MTLNITRGHDFERFVWSGLVKPFKSDDRYLDTTHTNVSDLTSWCIRKAYFNKVSPVAEERDDEEFNNFVRGKFSEFILSNHIFAPEYSAQSSFMFEGLVKAHPDLIDKKQNHVIELKDSNNSYHFTDPRHVKYNSFDTYLTQLLCYMVISGAERGTLLIKHSNSKIILDKLGWKKIPVDKADRMPLRAYELYLAKDDPIREFVKDNLRTKANFFLKAVRDRNVKLLPILRDASGPESKCNKCPYRAVCHSPENADTIGMEEMREVLRHDYITVRLREKKGLEVGGLGKLI